MAVLYNKKLKYDYNGETQEINLYKVPKNDSLLGAGIDAPSPSLRLDTKNAYSGFSINCNSVQPNASLPAAVKFDIAPTTTPVESVRVGTGAGASISGANVSVDLGAFSESVPLYTSQNDLPSTDSPRISVVDGTSRLYVAATPLASIGATPPTGLSTKFNANVFVPSYGASWLGTSYGASWLGTSDGASWLGTSDGAAWLGTSYGASWLGTSYGASWLGTSDGAAWKVQPQNIKQLVNAGAHTTAFAVRDLIPITLTGTYKECHQQEKDCAFPTLPNSTQQHMYLRVIAFDHNKDYETEGKNSITFGLVAPNPGRIATDRLWIEGCWYPNRESTWEESFIVKKTFPSILAAMPTDWVNVIGTTRKINATGKLFFPTIYEMSGLANDRGGADVYPKENQIPYELFKDSYYLHFLTLLTHRPNNSETYWGSSTWNNAHVAIWKTGEAVWGVSPNPAVTCGWYSDANSPFVQGAFPMFNIIAD